MPEIMPGTQIVYGPRDESGRDMPRAGRRITLVVVRGTMLVVQERHGELEVEAPAVVQWWPGERISYAPHSPDAQWMLVQSSMINPPMDQPAIGSLVVVTSDSSEEHAVGNVVSYTAAQDTADGAQFVTVDCLDSGINLYNLAEFQIAVVESPTSTS